MEYFSFQLFLFLHGSRQSYCTFCISNKNPFSISRQHSLLFCRISGNILFSSFKTIPIFKNKRHRILCDAYGRYENIFAYFLFFIINVNYSFVYMKYYAKLCKILHNFKIFTSIQFFKLF